MNQSFTDDTLQLQKKLPELDFGDAVFSSPLSRCLQLAEQLSGKVQIDSRLLELDFGDWENRRFDDLDHNALTHWTNHFVEEGPPNGESFADLHRRAGSFWQDILTLDSKRVVVVTHAGVIRALLAHILELPLANAFQFRVDPGSVHKLQHIDNYTFIDYLNR